MEPFNGKKNTGHQTYLSNKYPVWCVSVSVGEGLWPLFPFTTLVSCVPPYSHDFWFSSVSAVYVLMIFET